MANRYFDDTRIKDYPDKQLLHDIKAYFHTFVMGDYEAMKSFQTDGYSMTDIRKNLHTCPLLLS